MDKTNGGLKDIFSTILKDHQAGDGSRPLPPIIVLHGNGNVIAPGGTVHVVHRRLDEIGFDAAAGPAP